MHRALWQADAPCWPIRVNALLISPSEVHEVVPNSAFSAVFWGGGGRFALPASAAAARRNARGKAVSRM